MRQQLLNLAKKLRLPSICILCNQVHHATLALCTACMDLLPRPEHCCKHCALPLPDSSYLVCGHCIKTPPHFDNSLIGYLFEEPLRSLVHRFKYQNELYLSSFLTQLILNTWKKHPSYPQCLIPVPMHHKKLKNRGFNQTAILARSLSKQLKIPYDLNCCQKKRNTTPQAELNSQNRTQNLKGAFTVNPNSYRHVALIDDLLTTGSTVNELAATLKKTGIQQVDVWCCARAVKKQS